MIAPQKTKINRFLSFNQTKLSFEGTKLSRPSSTGAASRVFPLSLYVVRSMRTPARGQPARPPAAPVDGLLRRFAGLPTGSPRCTPYGPDAPSGLALRLKKCRGKPKPAPRLPESRPAVPPVRFVWPPGAMWRSLNLGGVAPAWGPFAPLRGAIYIPPPCNTGGKVPGLVRWWIWCEGRGHRSARPGQASGAPTGRAQRALDLSIEHFGTHNGKT
jgi:hypothetical protein